MADTAFLFSGQGAQYPGMMGTLFSEFPEAAALLHTADSVLGIPLSEVIAMGPADELNKTRNTQPALLTCEVAALTGRPFVTAENKFHALTSKDELVFAHGAVKAAACDMMKIANDVRWLASGPRLGLGEITIPANEPGSSIMPGKVNPTQCEQVTMVAVQIMGNDTAVSLAASQGNFELNVFMPVLIYNFLQSARLLTESVRAFNRNCAAGIRVNEEKMHGNLHGSLMLVTALNPYIGYENAAKVAHKAFEENTSLREACVKLGFLTEEKFDEVFQVNILTIRLTKCIIIETQREKRIYSLAQTRKKAYDVDALRRQHCFLMIPVPVCDSRFTTVPAGYEHAAEEWMKVPVSDSFSQT